MRNVIAWFFWMVVAGLLGVAGDSMHGVDRFFLNVIAYVLAAFLGFMAIGAGLQKLDDITSKVNSRR